MKYSYIIRINIIVVLLISLFPPFNFSQTYDRKRILYLDDTTRYLFDNENNYPDIEIDRSLNNINTAIMHGADDIMSIHEKSNKLRIEINNIATQKEIVGIDFNYIKKVTKLGRGWYIVPISALIGGIVGSINPDTGAGAGAALGILIALPFTGGYAIPLKEYFAFESERSIPKTFQLNISNVMQKYKVNYQRFPEMNMEIAADLLFKEKEYVNSMTLYKNIASNVNPIPEIVNRRIEIMNLLNKGDQYMEKDQFSNAIDTYKNAYSNNLLVSDMEKKIINEKISKAQSQKDIYLSKLKQKQDNEKRTKEEALIQQQREKLAREIEYTYPDASKLLIYLGQGLGYKYNTVSGLIMVSKFKLPDYETSDLYNYVERRFSYWGGNNIKNSDIAIISLNGLIQEVYFRGILVRN